MNLEGFASAFFMALYSLSDHHLVYVSVRDHYKILQNNIALRVTGTEGISKRDLRPPVSERCKDTWIEGNPSGH